MKKKAEAEKENGERWMLTYLDMITLLFVTFVVLYAISVADKAKFEAVAVSLSTAFGTIMATEESAGAGQGKVLTEEAQKAVSAPIQSKNARSIAYDNVYTLLKTEIKAGHMSVNQEERGLVVQLGANFFFKEGSAELPTFNNESILTLAMALTQIHYEIQIEGFADPNELTAPGSSFTSDWQLSAQRAVNLLEFFRDQGVPVERMRAVSYGSTKAVATNDTPEGRAYNRHVDILLLYDADVVVKPE
jgi:chemotaxis protein MotB